MSVLVGETKREVLTFTAWRTVGSVDASTDTITCNAHGFSDGNPVTVRVTVGELPGGLKANTTYYVVSSATNTLQLATSAGGTAIDLTSAGSGTIEISGPKDPDAVRLIVKDPSGTSTTYTYALSTVSKLTTGVYYKDYTYSSAGTYELRQEGDFTVSATTHTEPYQWSVIVQANNT